MDLFRKLLILASPTDNRVVLPADAGGGQFLHRQLAVILQVFALQPGDALLLGLDVAFDDVLFFGVCMVVVLVHVFYYKLIIASEAGEPAQGRSVAMSFNERGGRTPDNYDQVIIDRINRDTVIADRPSTAFVAVCDMLSIPRDLRAKTLRDLESQQLVTRVGDQVSLTERGKKRAGKTLTSKEIS